MSAAGPHAAAWPPVAAILDRLAAQIDVHTIDEVWTFPPRVAGQVESHLVVAATRPAADQDRRRIFAAQCLVRRDEKGRSTAEYTLAEYGTAPTESVRRVIEGVAHRLRPQPDTEMPRDHKIQGDPDRWAELCRAFDPSKQLPTNYAPVPTIHHGDSEDTELSRS